MSESVQPFNRRLGLIVYAHGVDKEWFGRDEQTHLTDCQETVFTGPNQTMEALGCRHGWGGECRLEVNLQALQNTDHSIRVFGYAKLFEGASESTNDIDGEVSIEFVVPKGGVIATHNFHVNNGRENGDRADIQIRAVNAIAE